jgi:hypothetical protein
MDHSRVSVSLRHKSMTFPQTQSINSDQQYTNAGTLRKLRYIREPIRLLTPIALTGFLIVPVSLLTAVLGTVTPTLLLCLLFMLRHYARRHHKQSGTLSLRKITLQRNDLFDWWRSMWGSQRHYPGRSMNIECSRIRWMTGVGKVAEEIEAIGRVRASKTLT